MPRTGIKEGFTKTNLARQYRDKWGMSMATKALARIMYNENNLIFTNLEDARSTLRAIEGKSGKGVRTIVHIKCQSGHEILIICLNQTSENGYHINWKDLKT